MTNGKKIITELTDILDQDIATIVALRMNAERNVSRHQRFIERITNTIGRPVTVYLILLLISLWMIINVLYHALGLVLLDPPPFPWLQDVVSISALGMTMIILTTQNRQGKLSEQRRHLDLQITLLTERKVSKVIELLEDLRHDLPSVINRTDPEAEIMKEPVDAHTALTALNQTLQEAAKEYKLEIE